MWNSRKNKPLVPANTRYNQLMETTKKARLILKNSDREAAKAALHDLQEELHSIYGKQAPTVLVYGSFARGDENPTSDVDVLLLYPKPVEPGREISRIGPILADLNLRYQVLISIFPAKASDYHQSTSSFWRNLRQEGVSIERI
jgi:predicted nucleotidyltransferase